MTTSVSKDSLNIISEEELKQEVALALKKPGLGAIYQIKCYKYIAKWEERKYRNVPTELDPSGEVKIRNRRRFNHLRDQGVIVERQMSQSTETEYTVVVESLNHAVEILRFLGTTLKYVLSKRDGAGTARGTLR